MKLSFSTLACPDWKMPEIVKVAASTGYDGIELRFVEGEDSIWKLPAFSRTALGLTKRSIANNGLEICCVDTSCRFHSPDIKERRGWMDEGERMSDLAAELGAPGIRVFGDTIQPGNDRASTQSWIADSIRRLAEITKPKKVEVWLESHGDFSTAAETAGIFSEAACENAGVVWDPANSFASGDECPVRGAETIGTAIRHIHIKDLQRNQSGWEYVLTGRGEFPFAKLKSALGYLGYDRFLSFEWEKKWHPEIENPEIALPHFVNWFHKSFIHD
jgi:sugar phosphate isomerase/epimerase